MTDIGQAMMKDIERDFVTITEYVATLRERMSPSLAEYTDVGDIVRAARQYLGEAIEEEL